MRRGQRHGDDGMASLGDIDAVDEAEIVDVDRDFRVIDFLERRDHRLVQRAAGLARRIARWLLREKAFEIVALALERLAWRFLRRFDARARRLLDRADFLDFDPVAHPKILVTRSMPRTNAATSSAVL
ncbi:hypothetical protein D9M73_177010 [compost metagenome]